VPRERTFKLLAPALAIAFIAIQFIPIARTNPSPNGSAVSPTEIQQTLTRACYDCHSNQTRWLWYSRVAPVSWYIAHEVNLGRQELNFSEWDSYLAITKYRKLLWMGRTLEDRTMPPAIYLSMHREAYLSPSDRQVLERWSADEAETYFAAGKKR